MTSYGRERHFSGLSLSEGTAFSRVCLFNEKRHNNLPVFKVEGQGVEREKGRLQGACKVVAERLDAIAANVKARIGPAEAEIFVAQRMMVEDAGLLDKMMNTVEHRGVNAEASVTEVLDAYETMLLEVDDAYIKERASDIGEVKRRLLDVLQNMNPALQCTGQAHCQRGRERIVVAEELTPSLTVDLDVEHTLGFVTERGGAGSHAAILAKALGIPAVSGIEGIHSMAPCGTEILVNGSTGEVILYPDETTVRRQVSASRAQPFAEQPAEPVEGFRVLANINRAGDVQAAKDEMAEGVGLYRTEFEFLSAGRALDEDEQFERYVHVADAMAPYPVTFRLLDIGGDKAAPFLDIPREENPYLGFRGARLLLGRPELFVPQARALARASQQRPVNVMYPMVADLDQFRRLRQAFLKTTADLPGTNLRHGLMIEVPSACIEAREILEEADFASIGTNDLIQYLFAVDRNNALVAQDYTPDRPALWSVIAGVVRAARDARKPLSLCGELAGDPKYLDRLLSLGIAAVSVSPRLIGKIRRMVRSKRDTVAGAMPATSQKG